MRIFRSPEQWRQILQDQQHSGLSVSAFCRQHKISTSGFFTQRKKHQAARANSTAFVPAKVTQQTSKEVVQHAHRHIVLELPSGKITLPVETPADYLLTLLNGLHA